MALKTRKPTGQVSWPFLLLAGAEKSGKSYAAAAFSASDLIGRTFWIEVGESDADMYGMSPGRTVRDRRARRHHGVHPPGRP